jgi:aconitate hydratase
LTPSRRIKNARLLAYFGDSITTDHISPAGKIAARGEAGKYLQELGGDPADLNTYGSRRGNHEVMARGTFSNPRLHNKLVGEQEGGITIFQPSGQEMSIYEAAKSYEEDRIPVILIAGKQYGTGSSRDWAAKGPFLLGVRAVLAESFERIHRSNLVMMGILPLQFLPEESAALWGIKGSETFTITEINDVHPAKQIVTVQVTQQDGTVTAFQAIARLDTPMEVQYYQHGGILPAIFSDICRKI